MKTTVDLEKFVKELFKPIDNFVRNNEFETQTILQSKASLLIHSVKQSPKCLNLFVSGFSTIANDKTNPGNFVSDHDRLFYLATQEGREFRYHNISRLLMHFGNPPCLRPYAKYTLSQRAICNEFFPIFEKDMWESWLDSSISPMLAREQYSEHQVSNFLDEWSGGTFKMKPIQFETLANGQPGVDESNGWQSIFTFKDRYGYAIQRATKEPVSDGHLTMKKGIVPVTYWQQNGSPWDYLHRVPLPDGQVLFDQHLIAKHPEHAIILADTVELAAINQQRMKSDILWTSWLGGVDSMDVVDWTPIEGRRVYVLISNHSGVGLAEAFLNAEKIADYLHEKVQDVDLHYLEVCVAYPGVTADLDLASFLRRVETKANRPVVESASVLDEAEFAESCNRAKCSLEPFSSVGIRAKPVAEESENNRPPVLDYLLFPVIKRGSLAILFSGEGIGKSSFAMSLCGSIISGKRPIEGKFWCVPKGVSDLVRVLYLNLEGVARKTDTDLEDKRRRHFDAYASQRDGQQRMQVVSDLPRPLDANTKSRLIDVFRDFKRAEPGNDNILVVVDHYLGMVGDPEPTKAWANVVMPFYQELVNEGATLLLVDHTNKSGSNQGRAAKRRNASNAISLSLPEGANGRGTLASPMTVDPGVKGRNIAVGRLANPFDACWDSKRNRWVLYDSENRRMLPKADCDEQELRDFGDIVNAYKADFPRDDVAELTGYAKSQYSDMLKRFQDMPKESD